MDDKVHKARPGKGARLMRLLRSTLDPRAYGHALKVVNYYNHTHVSELRQATRGKGLNISPTASFANGRNITLGDRVRIGANVSLWGGPGRGRIVMGDDSMIAPNTMLTAANYRFDDGAPINEQAMSEADIVIGRDVWIGANVVILPGTQIGDGSIVAAGAVVRGDWPPMSILSGNPAKAIGKRRAGEAPATATISPASESNTRVIALIRAEFPQLEDSQLEGPLDDTGIDSFDLITLRTAIEAATGRTVPDGEWGGITRLSDIARLPSLAGGATSGTPSGTMPAAKPAATTAPDPVQTAAPRTADTPGTAQIAPPAIPGRASRDYVINMPQMALSGLSEPWLFKEIGDLHWQMITEFLQSPSSAIQDEAGERLYATFTRLTLDVTPALVAVNENDMLRADSRLERYGASFFFGTHEFAAPGATCHARTMSTFAKHGERGKNTSLVKGAPILPDPEAVPSLDAFPEFGVEYRSRRAAEPGKAIFECDYEILPPHDINGVGLLYFAAYPTVFDLCLEQAEGKGFLMSHSTAGKDICYYANSEPDEVLTFRLYSKEIEADGTVVHHAALFRASDGVRMAEVISRKRPRG